MISYNTLIVLLGTGLLGACSGLVGSFAVLRRRSLVGDALAHAALPGICLSFMLLGERNLPAMLTGALVSGILGVMIVATLTRWTRIKEDAAIGIVLSVFFGAGIVLSRVVQNLTTTGSKAGLDSYILGKTAGMIAQDVYLIAGVSGVCLLVLLLLYKEFKLVAFDPAFAIAQGWPAYPLDLFLMVLIALTVVIGLPAVGVVLMAAMLILPGATARFWTERLGTMLVLATVLGLATGTLGTLFSARFSDMPAGPLIVLVGTALFLISLLLAPRRGAVARIVEHLRVRQKTEHDVLLRTVFDALEPRLPGNRSFDPAELAAQRSWSPLHWRRVLGRAKNAALVEPEPAGRFRLTDEGLRQAAHVACQYRLWELLLADRSELVEELMHPSVASPTAQLSPDVLHELENRLVLEGRWPQTLQPPATLNPQLATAR